MKTIDTEALIIGSGFGAAAPALHLLQAQLKTVMVEKGPMIDPRRDFVQTQDPRHYLTWLHSTSSDSISFTYAEGYGGGSGFYEMVTLRAPSAAFEQRGGDGRRLWPAGLDRKELDPYYGRAERMMNVHQIAMRDVPKTGAVFSHLMNNLGYSCDRACYAVRDCVGAGYCVSGCVFGAKQTLHMNYLAEAEKLGLEVHTSMEARRIRPLPQHDGMPGTKLHPRYEVVCRNTETGETVIFRAAIVVLGGGTIGTAALLLRSKEDLPDMSDQVGRNVTFNGSVKSAALLPEGFPEGDMYTGRSHPGMISYALLASEGITISCAKPLPLNVLSTARLVRKGRAGIDDYWGAEHVRLMRQFRRRGMVLYALGLTTLTAELTLDGDGNITPRLERSDELRSYYKRVLGILHSIYRRNDCAILDTVFIDGTGKAHDDIHCSSAHMMGSCRMADDPRYGVTDKNGEVFGYPGLFVSDGAAIPTALAVNSSLTITANAERIGEHIARRIVLARLRNAQLSEVHDEYARNSR